jgi:hypothetical protein
VVYWGRGRLKGGMGWVGVRGVGGQFVMGQLGGGGRGREGVISEYR